MKISFQANIAIDGDNATMESMVYMFKNIPWVEIYLPNTAVGKIVMVIDEKKYTDSNNTGV